ncbi:discoidin domain-containing protein [Sorangium sp. So ce134]
MERRALPLSLSDTRVELCELVNLGGWPQIQLSELALFGSPGTPVLPPPPAITASGENGPQEAAAKALDGRSITMWLTFASSGWISYEFPSAVTIGRYAIYSANDSPERDPSDWTLEASNDGVTWSPLDAVGSSTEQDLREISREVVEGLYTEPGAYWARRKILNIDVEDRTEYAWAGYDGDEATRLHPPARRASRPHRPAGRGFRVRG